MAVKCVTVECIPTLIQLRRPVHAVYCAAMRRFGLEVDEEMVKRAYTHGFKTTQMKYPHFGVTLDGALKYYKDWWRVSVFETLNAPGMPATGWSADEFDLFFQHVFSEFGSVTTWQAQPDAKEFLQRCQAAGEPSLHLGDSSQSRMPCPALALTLAVVSNGSSGMVTGLLDNSYARYIDDTLPLCDGLHEALHFSVLGADYEPPLLKPSAAAFDEALRKANVAQRMFGNGVGDIGPGEMLHLGNRLNVDYAGAMGAGWKALVLDRTGSVREKLRKGEIDFSKLGCELTPDDVVGDLTEALSAMHARGYL
ncbi:Haloacid dehalogenase-like hydrolase domain-containing protein 3 [Perkinsus olseni]|uniref:Haloacid dehalogenase-like hydrolase domain-containing protein 3 n=1 Tax=Perkinsus olseni TaxID=32597 RepID=A0A7J6LFJ3_PEROL|nr:Haloacid dehalogenase-like hydrolase domain-containing protein 3 [Perkinsus olseni]